jgi:multidrug efflux system outer membrane protein
MAAFETIRLSLHAEVATLYFTLRSTDAELSTVQQTVTLRKEALDIVKSRFAAGGSTELEVARAETELASAESDLAVITRRRHELRTSLAVLLGEPASTLQIPAQVSFQIHVPTVPAGLPSELLERRPDIAEAERDLAARNARIGVAKAAFFPTVKVTGFGGFESADVETLFNWQSRIWSIGPSITLPIFQTGRNRAALRQSQAAWSEGVAQYRQRVLLAFKEVQDALTASRLLKEQADAQHRALEGARRVAELSRKRYDAGFVGYLDVVESERTLLGFERATLQTAGQRLVVSVQLIKALGGGWANQ